MSYVTTSRKLSKNKQVKTLLGADVKHVFQQGIERYIEKYESVIGVGWGYKATSHTLRESCKKFGRKYYALEDGFIAWMDHPALTKEQNRLSYILDNVGMYYDASCNSKLDQLIRSQAHVDEERVNAIIQYICDWGITKYNHRRVDLSNIQNTSWHSLDLSNGYVLVIDQTANDASIEFALGCQEDFHRMLQEAFVHAQREKLPVVIKTHPDVTVGKKTGCINRKWIEPLSREVSCVWLNEDCKVDQLITHAESVFTVSSQVGFEGLMRGKFVHTFAWPFYAGRGLTIDRALMPIPYERPRAGFHAFFQNALIEYPIYIHPEKQERCSIEDVLFYIQAVKQSQCLQANTVDIYDVSLWKRSFLPEFLQNSVNSLRFSSSTKVGGNQNDVSIIWGMNSPITANQNTWRIEDGFIRSVGLGADLRRPSSLVVDDVGIYYNGKTPSRLEVLLSEYELNNLEVARSERLITSLKRDGISKYNVATDSELSYLRKIDKEIILVTAQFQNDQSMLFGAEKINTNLALLAQVRQQYPEAYIIYKEHPDVYSGVRGGGLTETEVLKYADAYLTGVALSALFKVVDRVCTICSLAGFEALIHGKKVNTYGLPFYGGWGLTSDYCSFPRRTRALTLNELVYISLVLYPRYVNWETRQITTVESVVESIKKSKEDGERKLKSTWLARQLRKTSYLSQSLLKRRH